MQQTNKHITLLTTNALGFPFLIRHKAIKFTGEDNKPYIIHRTTSGVEIISYEQFMKQRHIILHKRYPLRRKFDAQQIKTEHNQEPFDWMTNNCEDFASEVIEEVSCERMRPHSPQRVMWIAIVAIILVLMVIIKNGRI